MLLRKTLAAAIALATMGALSACVDSGTGTAELLIQQEIPSLPAGIPAFAGARPLIGDGDSIYQLTSAQQSDFLDFFNDPAKRRQPPERRIVEYLERSTSAYQYSNATHTAEEVLRLKGGNCLSLANLTTALARLAEVEVNYQLITDTPVFEKAEDVVVRSVHVRSKLLRPRAELMPNRYDVDFGGGYYRSGVIIDYFPSGNGRFIGNIAEPKFTAMYYRNLAADAITAADYGRAYWLVKASLEHAPDHAEALNMLAVIYRRAGDEQTAEDIYIYGIATVDDKLSLLKNYRALLQMQDRIVEAEEVQLRLASIEDTDPFEWWFMAEDAYGKARYDEALTYYKKSVKIAPYLHEGYFGMAKTYYQMGNIESARKSLRDAVDNANRLNTRSLYEAKLTALSRHQ